MTTPPCLSLIVVNKTYQLPICVLPVHFHHAPSIEPTIGTISTTALNPTDPSIRTHPSRSHLIPIITSLYLGTFLVALDTTILNPILLTITQTFHALDHIAWYGSAYLLALTALQPTLGKLYKVGNVKALYIASVVVFGGTYMFLFRIEKKKESEKKGYC